MNPNPIHRLLDDVVQTGELPSDEQIRDVITRGPAVGAKREARRQIAVAAKRIIGALDAGLPDQAAALAADTGDSLAEYTGTGVTDYDGRRLAGAIQGSDRGRRDRAGGDPAPIRDALLSAVRDGGIRAADLDGIEPRRDAADAEVQAWRDSLINESRRIAKVYASGNQGAARRMATELAVRHAGMVAPGQRADPAEGVTDPRELAAIITGARTSRA